jgi:hypothetical protein
MDFLSIKSEYESYKAHIDNTENTMRCISTFFINSQKNLNDYAESTKDNLNKLFHNLLNCDNRSTHIKKFFEFCRIFEKHIMKLTNIAKKIQSELILPTNDFTKYIMNSNNTQLIELKKIFDDISNQKRKYDLTKNNYFNICKRAERQEKVLLNEMNKKNSTNISINEQNEILAKLKMESGLEYQKYKDEHKITSDLFSKMNVKYFNIINILRDNEEKRINYISFHLEKYISLIEEQKNSLNAGLISIGRSETNGKNKLMSFKVKLDEDMKIYQDKFNYIYKSDERFINENFVSYDIYRRKIESIINNTNNLIQKGNDLDLFNTPMSPFPNMQTSSNDYNQNIFSIGNENVVLENNDSIIYNNLFSENPVNINKKLFSDFLKKLNNNVSFCDEIMNKSLSEYFYKQLYHEFKTIEQFEQMTQILIEISKNKEIHENYLEINFGIILIAEKGFYIDKINNNKKIYLCKAISDDRNSNFFKEKNFWKNLLNYQINKTINNYTNKALNEEIQTSKKQVNTNIQNLTSTVKYIIDIGTGARNLSKLREKKEKEILNKELLKIIKDFVIHFNNFNLDMVYINDIIMEISNIYQLENEQISFLICLINSNMYTIKAYDKKIQNNKQIDYYNGKISGNNMSKKYLFTNKILYTNNIKLKNLLLSLNSCFMFLEQKDYINIQSLNKFYYSNCQKLIYKQIFIKNDYKQAYNYNLFINSDLSDINKHIGMWFYYLKYDKNKIKYKEILEKVNSDNIENKIKLIKDVIVLDVNRTFFSTNQKEKREILKNILYSLAYLYPKVSYCQGMNFICQFLLEATKDEEKAFDIFSAILNKTKYGNLIEDEFSLMKKYFYVFERLIILYLPELATLLKKNNVNPSYYISPWFITLFTHSFVENQTKLLLRIFDLFILDGWISVIKIGLMLLKHYEKVLMDLNFEELLNFLINDLKEKYDFFNNNNYEKFMELYQDMKIPKGLVSNIENEYELEMKIISKQVQREKEEKQKQKEMNI